MLISKNSALCSFVNSSLVKISTCFYNLLISSVSGWVFCEPHACNPTPHSLIFSCIAARAENDPLLEIQFSLTVFSQSSHKSQDSSNLKPRVPLFRNSLSDLVYIINGRWSEAWDTKWVTVVARNQFFHSLLATALSNLCLVLASPSLLLFHVKG